MGLALPFIIEITKPFFHLGGLELVVFRIKSLNVVHSAPTKLLIFIAHMY